jgi:predicted transcriptional regulator
MSSKNRLITDFYDLCVKQLMDSRTWDMPLMEENDDIDHVFSILEGRHHIWIVKDKITMKLIGVITEHDILTILAPKNFSSFVVGMPRIESIEQGNVKTAGDIMNRKVIDCKPDDKIINVLNKMLEYEIRRLPVVINNKLIGELTLHQLIRKYYTATQFIPIDESEKGV